MKVNRSVMAVGVVVGVAVGAAVFRVSTAPDRIRARVEVAKATCAQTGGQWVQDGRQEGCRSAPARD